jgi:hypothetical protein
MKSFLLKGKKPICKWGMVPEETYFEGTVPEGYSLAVSPSDNYIVVDVDRHGDIDGFKNIPTHLGHELANTLKYPTKNDGMHYWFKYSGKKPLANKASSIGIDLRTDRGYAVWYPKEDIRDCLNGISETSDKLNEWLEKLFSFV